MSEFQKPYTSLFTFLFLLIFSTNFFAAEDFSVGALANRSPEHQSLEHRAFDVSQADDDADHNIMFVVAPVIVPVATVTIAAAAQVTAGICFLGGCLYSIFWSADAKNKSKHGSCNNESGNGNRCFCGHACGAGCDCVCYCACGTRNQQLQEDAKKNPHGKYEDAGYHHKNSAGNGKGGKAAAPKNGQQALNNSIPMAGDGTGRVGVSEGQIVILRLTSINVYHGFVISWEALSSRDCWSATVNDMIKSGLINGKGKILK